MSRIVPVLKLFSNARAKALHFAIYHNILYSAPTLIIKYFRYSRFRISSVLFQFHKQHQYPIRNHIPKPVTCVKSSPGFPSNTLQMIS